MEEVEVGNVVMLRGTDTRGPAMTVESVTDTSVGVLWFNGNEDDTVWTLNRAQLPRNAIVVTDAWDPEADE